MHSGAERHPIDDASSPPGGPAAIEPGRRERAGAAAVGGRSRPRVMVVAEGGDTRAFLRGVLSDAYHLRVLADVSGARAEIRRFRPDILVADVVAPGMRGIELVREIRADSRLAGLPAVLISTGPGEQAVTSGLSAGADDCLVEPFSVGELRARLARILERVRVRARDASWRRAVMAAFHDPLVIADESGRVIEFNDAFTDLFGWSMDDGPFDPPHPWWAGRASDGLDISDSGREWMPQEVQLVTKEGKRLWVAPRVRRIDGSHALGALTLTTLRDVSREHDSRERRAAAVRLSAELAAAQDLTQVLSAAVAGFAELFDGDSTVQAMAGDAEHVFTAAGPVRRAGVTAHVWEAINRPDPWGQVPAAASTAPVPGLLLVPDLADSRCRVWVQFARPRRVSADERVVGGVLAQAFSLAADRVLAAGDFADREAHLRKAIESHRLVGHAVGILIERHRLTPAEAFAMLRTASQQRNIKLPEIAARVIETGTDPRETN